MEHFNDLCKVFKNLKCGKYTIKEYCYLSSDVELVDDKNNVIVTAFVDALDKYANDWGDTIVEPDYSFKTKNIHNNELFKK